MLTSNKYTDYLVWCFLRFILYSFLLTFALYSYNDLPKYALEFKQDLYRSAKLTGIELPQFIKDQIVHPIPFFSIIIYVVVGVSALAILGFKFYFNPVFFSYSFYFYFLVFFFILHNLLH